MGYEDISLRVDAADRDHDTVDRIAEDIVMERLIATDVYTAQFRHGGGRLTEQTPDGPLTTIRLGDVVPTQYIIYIDRVPSALVEHLRQELAEVFIVLDDDFRCLPREQQRQEQKTPSHNDDVTDFSQPFHADLGLWEGSYGDSGGEGELTAV